MREVERTLDVTVSVIFTTSAEQRKIALEAIADHDGSGTFSDPIVTEVATLTGFYPAEGYHQGYYRNHSEQPYCEAMISPKIAKLRKRYLSRLKGATTGT